MSEVLNSGAERLAGSLASKDSKAVFQRPEIFVSLAMAMAREGKVQAVRALIAEALAEHPGDPLFAQLAHFVLARGIPVYHGQMLADHARNAAYRRAIEAQVPGKVVLDIGTGSGLLAMMAARAGASRVIACEMDASLAETARRIIAANGLADRIEVHACHSSVLDRASLFPGGVDVVLSEIFSANLLGEGVLETLDHARKHLCAPGACFIPEAAEIKVALASLAPQLPALGAVEGFDLELFAAHLPLAMPIANCDPQLTVMSAAQTLAAFEFASSAGCAATGHARIELLADKGCANAIAQWLAISFGAGVYYENSPGSDPVAHWHIISYPFRQQRSFAQGDSVAVNAFHHSDALMIWADEASGPLD